MKIALYIEDGLEQIVLTPESDTEKAILGKLNDRTSMHSVSIKSGTFYACHGGWVRQSSGDESTIIVIRRKPTDEQRGSGAASELDSEEASTP